jgi:hypothetical protein
MKKKEKKVAGLLKPRGKSRFFFLRPTFRPPQRTLKGFSRHRMVFQGGHSKLTFSKSTTIYSSKLDLEDEGKKSDEGSRKEEGSGQGGGKSSGGWGLGWLRDLRVLGDFGESR